MGLLEKVLSSITDELEQINERLSNLEEKSRYNGDIEMLTVAEAAEKMSISKSQLYKMIQRGEIPVVEVGSRKLIPRRKLREWIDENTTRLPDQALAG